jgi:hypothetical protein
MVTAAHHKAQALRGVVLKAKVVVRGCSTPVLVALHSRLQVTKAAVISLQMWRYSLRL